MNLGRRTLIKSIFIAGSAYAMWDFWKHELLSSKPSYQWQSEFGLIFAHLTPVVVGRAFSKLEQERIVAIVPSMITTLPLQTQKDLIRLLQLLSKAPVYRFLGMSSWENPKADVIHRFLKTWQQSNFVVWRDAYYGLSRICLAAWYGQEQANIEISYVLPLVIQEYIQL